MKTKMGNPNEPWCPVCREYTELHLKGRESAYYTCNQCGSDTWKPTSPAIYGSVVILILAFLNFMAFAIGPDVERDGGNETIDFFSQIEIWIVQIFVMGANVLFLRVVWKNAVHWRKFHKWRKRHYQELIDASRKQK
mgnify:CR=1 FL=1